MSHRYTGPSLVKSSACILGLRKDIKVKEMEKHEHVSWGPTSADFYKGICLTLLNRLMKFDGERFTHAVGVCNDAWVNALSPSTFSSLVASPLMLDKV